MSEPESVACDLWLRLVWLRAGVQNVIRAILDQFPACLEEDVRNIVTTLQTDPVLSSTCLKRDYLSRLLKELVKLVESCGSQIPDELADYVAEVLLNNRIELNEVHDIQYIATH
jgi:hypothetical protein